jgi:hypothetical protein
MVLNLNQKSRIIWRAVKKKSLRVIADEIGCHQTVANIIHKFLVNGNLEPKNFIYVSIIYFHLCTKIFQKYHFVSNFKLARLYVSYSKNTTY